MSPFESIGKFQILDRGSQIGVLPVKEKVNLQSNICNLQCLSRSSR